MSNTNKDTNAASTPSFVSALVVAGITTGVFTAVWLVLHSRQSLKRVYQPRVDLAPEAKRPNALPSNAVGFWKTVFMTPDTDIIVANGVDAYFFARYLKVFGLHMLVPYILLTFTVCIPLSAIKPNAGQDGLNILTFGNVAAEKQNRHIGHFIVAFVLIFWTLFILWREYNHFVEIRQGWLSSNQHLTLARTRTLVLTNLPDSVNSAAGIKELGGVVGRLTGPIAPRPSNVTDGTAVATNGSETGGSDTGGVRQVWLTRKVKDVEKVWEERDKECARLESGASKLIKLGNKNYIKGKTPEKQGKVDTESAGANMVDRFVLHKKRPTWKQGLLGLIGKKMTLESSPSYIAEHTAQLDSLRSGIDSLPLGNTAFVRFDSQTEAHAFARLVSSTDKKHRLIKAGTEMVPEDVQWSNISMSPYQRKIRTIISWALTIGLIIVWAVPVAFVGVVTNIDAMCTKVSWLSWVCTKLPAPALGIVKGVLPPVGLAILFMLLPIVLRMWVKLQGEVRRSDIELKLFSRFWLFQVVHGFIVITVASGLISALSQPGDLAPQLPTLLAEKLPNASIFFLTFVLTVTLANAAKAYSRAIPTVMYMLRGILGGSTPRKIFLTTFKMDQFAWATTWPPICLVICITIVYSVIQPLICLLTLVAFTLFYAAYKYLLNWTADQPDSLETGGLFYIKALRTVFVALYLEEICLAGLFFLSTDQTGGRSKSGLACGAIMIAVIVITACFQAYIDHIKFKNDYLVYAHSSTTHTHKSSHSKVTEVGRVHTSASDEANAAGPEHGNTSGFHEQAFDHPALWKKQPTIWLANDTLGIGKFESERIREAGVESSTDFAHMDDKAKITVERGPPDEAWYGGYTAQ